MIFITLVILLHLTAFIYMYIKFSKDYRLWSSQDVPSLPPTFPLGTLNFKIMFSNFGDTMVDVYNQFKSKGNYDYGGLFFLNKPVLLVLSPEFAKIVLVRDFQYFTNRGVYFDRAGDPLSANLFFIENDEWKSLRAKMTKTFTMGKIRVMFNSLSSVGTKLIDSLRPLVGDTDGGTTTEITEFLFRYNTDVIGSCAFGIECNTIGHSNSEFRNVGKKMLQFTRIKLFKLYVAMLFRKEARAMGFKLVDVDVTHFISKVVREAIQYRKENPKLIFNDFLQLMIDLLAENNEFSAEQQPLTVDEIAANVFVFFFAGFETSSTAMAYCLYELALNPDIQQRVRAEISLVNEKHNGNSTYSGLVEMTYLEQVINETMRKHPAVGTLHRVSNNDYTLPNGAIMPKGTYVIIPVLAFHRDPNLYENPDQFNPDRFSEQYKRTINPFSFLPFGEGPRACIGMKFGWMQTKFGLAKLLEHFEFSVCEKTKIPLPIDSVSLLHIPKGGVYLKMKLIK